MSFLIPLALMYKGSYRYRIVNGHVNVSYKWSIALIVAFGITVLIKGLPYDTQTDWIYYYEHIEAVTAGKLNHWGNHTEPGYRFLINALAFLRMPKMTFFLLCAFLLYYSLLKFSVFFQKAAPLIFLLCFPFLFTTSINLFRQFLSMSLLLLSVYSYLNRKYKESFILFGAAFLFHIVVIFFPLVIPIEWLCKKYKINKYWIIAILLTNTILGMSVLRPFLEIANSITASLTQMNTHTYNLESLIEEEWEQNYVWLKTGLAVITILLSDSFKNENRIMSFLFYSCSFYYIISPFCQQLELSRIALLWRIFFPFLLGYMVYSYIKKQHLIKLLLISPVILFQYMVLFQNLSRISVLHPYIIRLL